MTDNLELNMEAFLPLRDVVFRTLREAIIKGELKPGERLMEVQLAEKLGVSRTPVREAIRMLEQDGLAVTIPRRGAEVAHMTEKDMENVLQIREVLDELAVQLAAENMTDEQMETLEDAALEFEQAIQEENVKQLAQADVVFHDIIYGATENKRLVAIINNLREQMFRYRIEYLRDKEAYPTLMREHRAIVEGLKKRDKESVSEIMRAHIRNQVEAVKDIIRKQE